MDFYLLLKQRPQNGQPPRYFFNHVATRASYEKKKGEIEILGVIDPRPDFVGGKLLSGKQKVIAICNQYNARVGRIKLSSSGPSHQRTGSKAPPSSRDVARLLEPRKEE